MHKKWLIPWVLGFGLLMETLDSTVLNTALPQMAISFQANALTLKLAIVSYIITLAAFLPLSGYATDRWGTKKVFFFAVTVFIASSFWCGISQHLPELIIGRLLQGVGGAMVTPVGRLILLKSFSRSEFIKAFTSLVLIGQLGIAFGPTVGGVLTTFMGWRWVFFINLPIGLILLALIAYFIPNYRETVKYKLDIFGFLLFSIGIGLMTFGLALMTEQAFEHNGLSISLITLGLLLFGLYFWHAKYSSRPLLDFSLMRIRTFRISVLGNLLVRIPLNAPFFLLMLLLQITFGYSAFKAGLFLIPYGLCMVLTKPLLKKILSFFGFRRFLLINPALLAVFIFLFSRITNTTPDWLVLLMVAFLGILSSFQFSSMNSLAFADIEPSQTANASMITGVGQQLALSLSVCIAAGFLVALSRFYHVELLTLSTFHTAFMLLSIIMVSSILIFRQLRPGDGNSLLH